MLEIQKKVKVHFIGIGGIGMSGIAQVLLALGHQVSGSDLSESKNTQELKNNGAEIFIGHNEKNIGNDCAVVVYSSAVNEKNPERQQAQKLGIPLMRRAEMLAELMRLKWGVAVAGTHGKTTTTSLLSTLLIESGQKPTYIIGGVVQNLKGHAAIGEGKIIVAEADESDGSFLLLNPVFSIITNIDDDHLDFYGSSQKIIEAFTKFARKTPFYGLCMLNAHDDRTPGLIKTMARPWASFGIEGKSTELSNIDYAAKNILIQEEYTIFDLIEKGKNLGRIHLPLHGEHNVLNALAAIGLGLHLKISYSKIEKALRAFKGVGRRFEKIYQSEKLTIIDDYAHHPTEVAATLKAVRALYPTKKVTVLFEPHRYSRTRDCWGDFLNVFNSCDHLALLPIYAASETSLPGISSKALSRDINALHPKLSNDFKDMDNFFKEFNQDQSESILVTLGAGSIGRKIRNHCEQFKS